MVDQSERPFIDASPHRGGEIFVTVVWLGCTALTIGLYFANRNGAGWIVSAVFTALALLWLLWVLAQRRRRIRVFADRIEQQSLFGTRRLRFDQVERVRLGPYRPVHATLESVVQAYLAQIGLGDQHFELGATAESEVRLYGAGVKVVCTLGYAGDSVALWRRVAPQVLPRLCEKLDHTPTSSFAI